MPEFTVHIPVEVKEFLGPDLDLESFPARMQEQAERMTTARQNLEGREYIARSSDRLVTVTLGAYGGILDVRVEPHAEHALVTGRLGASVLDAIHRGQAEVQVAHREELRHAIPSEQLLDQMFEHWPTAPVEDDDVTEDDGRPLGQLRAPR
ncbi:MAG: YbaB/EbfC family nucleoid-associated protein [Phycicoccus sp.]